MVINPFLAKVDFCCITGVVVPIVVMQQVFASKDFMPRVIRAKQTLLALGDRKSQRPFQLLRNANQSNIKDVLKVQKLGKQTWKSQVKMPDEKFEHHTGWKPGPVPGHKAPEFKGGKFGIAEKHSGLGRF